MYHRRWKEGKPLWQSCSTKTYKTKILLHFVYSLKIIFPMNTTCKSEFLSGLPIYLYISMLVTLKCVCTILVLLKLFFVNYILLQGYLHILSRGLKRVLAFTDSQQSPLDLKQLMKLFCHPLMNKTTLFNPCSLGTNLGTP